MECVYHYFHHFIDKLPFVIISVLKMLQVFHKTSISTAPNFILYVLIILHPSYNIKNMLFTINLLNFSFLKTPKKLYLSVDINLYYPKCTSYNKIIYPIILKVLLVCYLSFFQVIKKNVCARKFSGLKYI